MSENSSDPKQNIQDRFSERRQAERYRDRFKKGRRKVTHEREVAALEKTLTELPAVQVVMDVACGAGRFAETLAAHSQKLIQTDYSPHMLDINREDHPLGAKSGGYFQADARAIPMSDNSVDLIFCHRFLNHVPESADRERIMKEFARISRSYVVVSCLGPPKLIRVLRRFYDQLKGKKSLDGHVEMDDLITNAADVGLELVRKTPIRNGFVSGAFMTFKKK
jgi:ubiquinone/menaquinone biosynthesis C-methylase UbiE